MVFERRSRVNKRSGNSRPTYHHHSAFNAYTSLHRLPTIQFSPCPLLPPIPRRTRGRKTHAAPPWNRPHKCAVEQLRLDVTLLPSRWFLTLKLYCVTNYRAILPLNRQSPRSFYSYTVRYTNCGRRKQALWYIIYYNIIISEHHGFKIYTPIA